jgi:hypothetical protein
LCDRQWQEVLRGVQVKRMLYGAGDCLSHVHDISLRGLVICKK